MPKRKYLTASQLDILPEERKALIAFVEAPALGRTISVNGHAHYYDQSYADTEEGGDTAENNECGTAGCVAGFVFAHARAVQGKRSLRGKRTAGEYLNEAAEMSHYYDDDDGNYLHDRKPIYPFFNDLYCNGNEHMKLSEARKVVERGLRTGKINWPRP